MAHIRKTASITGRRLLLVNASETDAQFIHALRTDPVRTRFLSPVPPDVGAQVAWLRSYARDATQAYFLIHAIETGEKLGMIRMHGARGDAFSWGSWLLKAGAPAYCAIESLLMVYSYGLWLGFRSTYFKVYRNNPSARFHKNFGARLVSEQNGELHYVLSFDALNAGLEKYRRYLPDGIRVDCGESLGRG